MVVVDEWNEPIGRLILSLVSSLFIRSTPAPSAERMRLDIAETIISQVRYGWILGRSD